MLFGYLILWFVALIGALGVGAATHAAQAYLQPYPEKLFDGGTISDWALNETLSPHYNAFGKHDEVGWWEFYSLRNYLLHAVPLVLLVVATGMLNWSERAQVVAMTCDGLGRVGLTPMFCG